MNTIQLTAEQMAAWERGEAIRKVEKWEPKPGNFCIDFDGEVGGSDEHAAIQDDMAGDYGNTWQTREHAEIAASYVRKVQRMLCWVFEHYPEWDGHGQYFPRVIAENWEPVPLSGMCSITPRLPLGICDHLCRELNAGRVEL